MGLSSVLLIKLGTSVAKATLKLWLKDYEFAQNISVDIADMLEGKFEDILVKRKTERFFDRIAEEIAGEVDKQLKGKEENLSTQQKEKIAKAVMTTFNSTPLSKKIVFEKDLDPLNLFSYLLENGGSDFEGNLTSNEFFKYKKVLLESCNYIIEIISTLPDFDLNKTKELLKRETESIELIKTILENLPLSRAETGKIEDDKFETEYCRKVVRKLDSIELFGVSLSHVKSRYNLSIAYISLDLSYYMDEDAQYSRAEDALSTSSRLLIRGEPGSGKTTLLQWIAVNAIRKQFTGQLSQWNEYIPFFIRLRNYSDTDFPTPEQFIESVAKNSKEFMPKGWVNRKLELGKCLILIDGVDELPPSLRDKAEDWLIDLLSDYPNCIFVISTRPSAVELGWLSEFEFEDLMLQPMSLNEISKFIDHWYMASREIALDTDPEIDRYKQTLKQIIGDTPSIRNLASTPLLCAMLCVLNIDRKSQIPKDRMELYRISLETLLDRRDVERRINTKISLTRVEKEILLQDLSYWLLLNNYTDCKNHEAIERVNKGILSIPRLKQEKPKDIFNELLERSGLLREPTIGRVNFIHKTFQEYLSAKMAIQENDIGVLIQNSFSDQWKEVIILAVGHANMEQVDRLISGLLKHKTENRKMKKTIQFLAVACMETATQLSKTTSKLLDDTSKSLFPPTSDHDAKDLSSAGEGVIDYLTGYQNKSNKIISSCIKTLTWIGGSRAIEAIGEYSNNPKLSTINTLLWAWEYFDQVEFAKKVLSNTNYKGPVKIEDKYHLDGLNYLQELEFLYINNCSIDNLTPIGELKFLKSLIIEDCPNLHSAEALQKCENLEVFELQGSNHIESFKFLEKLKKIKTLNLSGCIEFTEINYLSKLNHLENLNIDGCFGITDISALSNLKKLKTLTLPTVGLMDDLPRDMLDSVEII